MSTQFTINNTDLQTALSNKADLVSGLIPSTQLPSYVDDVLEFDTLIDLPLIGVEGKIYVTKDTNLIYRWTGSLYANISQSLALGETSSTAYRGDWGKIAYDHSQTTGNPHGLTKTDLGLENVDNTSDLNKPISTATQTVLNDKVDVVGDTMTGNLTVPNITVATSYTTTGNEPVGTVFYDNNQEDWILKTSTDTNYNIGGELSPLMKNGDTFTHLNGQPVYVFSGNGKLPVVKLADASTELESYTIALATQDVLHTGSGKGRYCSFGNVSNVHIPNVIQTGESDTLWIEGAWLYLSTETGKLTTVRPVAPNHGVIIGRITDRSGSNINIFVSVVLGSELDELHNVDLTLANTGDTIFKDTDGVWRTKTLDNYIENTLFSDAKDPTGWLDYTAISVSYDKTNRTATLTGDLTYYWRGVKKNLTSPFVSTAHANTDGLHFLYSNDGTNFIWSNTVWEFSDIMVCLVIKSTTPEHHFAIREIHGLMPYQAHKEFHETNGTYRKSGVGVTAGSYAENTATDLATTPAFDFGIIADEDNIVNIPALPKGTYTTMRMGAGGITTFDTTSNFPFRSSGSFLLVNDPITGAETVGTSNNYYNVYQIVIPTTADTDSQKYRMVFLQPQKTYTSLGLAQAESISELNLGNFTGLVAEYIFYTRITYRTLSGNPNTGKVTIPVGGISNVNLSRIQTATVVGAVNASTVSFVPTGNISSGDVQDALTELDNEKASLTGATFTGNITANQLATNIQTFTPTGTTQTINWNSGSIVNLSLASASGNVTLTLNNPTATSYLIIVSQGATPRNLTFPVGTIQVGGGGNTYTGIANQKDLLSLLWTGTEYILSVSRIIS